MARVVKKKRSLEAAFAGFSQDEAGTLLREFAAFARDVTEMEAPDDPKEKLREKDKKLVLRVNDLFRSIRNARNAGDITRAETVLFFKIQILFNLIERILWELKGESGDPPELPDPYQPPPDSGPTP